MFCAGQARGSKDGTPCQKDVQVSQRGCAFACRFCSRSSWAGGSHGRPGRVLAQRERQMGSLFPIGITGLPRGFREAGGAADR
eukprot:1159876-Alexandrium_andersonii.AAC.1